MRDNAQLVARAAGLARIAQRPPATPAETREVLGYPVRMTVFPYATVEVVRSGFVESVHAGSGVVLAPSGRLLAAPPATRTRRCCRARRTSRCSWSACSRPGWRCRRRTSPSAPARTPASRCTSDRVLDLLAGAGVPPAALVCPPALPLDETAAAAVLRAGGGPERVDR